MLLSYFLLYTSWIVCICHSFPAKQTPIRYFSNASKIKSLSLHGNIRDSFELNTLAQDSLKQGEIKVGETIISDILIFVKFMNISSAYLGGTCSSLEVYACHSEMQYLVISEVTKI
jgi:hypothetical protein